MISFTANDPVAGYVWDEVNNRWMEPALLFSGHWQPVRLQEEQRRDPAYRFDPGRHRLYADALWEQAEARARETSQEAYSADYARTREAIEQLVYWGRYTDARRIAGIFGERYAGSSDPDVQLNDHTRVTIPEPPLPLPPSPQGARVKNPTLLGRFDGSQFTVENRVGNHVVGESYPAVSGKPDSQGRFDYSPERQRIPERGPIPEGTYWINPQEIIKRENTGWLNRFLGSWGAGLFPGGADSWGQGKIEINPREVEIDGVKRGNFTIHGGKVPGSRGCIDLTESDSRFFNFLEKHRGNQDSIPIFVRYPKEKRP